ncbi:MAG: NAD(P)/FAD-dependent oxidoreductase [Bacteroidia bacterium]|nr:NAD(P)/FAD-dependent oxidoreductase [Bacteroidia bacterium]
MIDVAVIGGGAAGFYCAIRIKELAPNLNVAIFEKTGKTLTKVRVSGGGRCNVTHDCNKTSELITNYPRGASFLKKVFHKFGVDQFLDWLHAHKVQTKVEADGRIFPASNSSETIAGLFEFLAHKLNIEVHRNHEWMGFERENNQFQHEFNDRLNSKKINIHSKYTVVATGGIPDLGKVIWKSDFEWIAPVPSLFTFNADKADLNKLKPLSGVSVSNCRIKVMGEKESYQGPILITHWGISGPAVLKTSAWMARKLFDNQYKFKVLISWVGELNEDDLRTLIYQEIEKNSKKLWKNISIVDLPNRLWDLILNECEIDTNSICGTSSKKLVNRLVESLLRYPIEISGKTTFKEEFVTAGGISTESVSPKSMEIRNQPGIYVCGEVLDIDGVTGGFNFQGAWSTSEIAARAISNKS